MSDEAAHRPANWELKEETLHADCRVFDVVKRRFRHPRRGSEDDFYVIDAFDWGVAIALTPQREILMVEQFRFGVQKLSWEFPAGCVDAGEDPVAAAHRELLEETGYAGDKGHLIGQSHPNPAMQDNTCYYTLIENVRQVQSPQWEGHEELRLRAFPVDEVFRMARDGRIHHAMVHNGLIYLLPYLQLRT